MNPIKKPNSASMEAAEKLLRTLYGDDFAGCNVRLDTVAEIIQEAVDIEAIKSKMLVNVIEKIGELSTPPQVGEVTDMTHLAKILGSRADGIRLLTQETLSAWNNVNAIS